MLHTTPESLEESQPLTNEDESLVLVMDCRVDNWEELRRDLLGRGAILRNRSDAELVLRAYELWGRECLQRIDGDFALVIWDIRRQVAFCARDRMGNKPFNYHWNGKTLVFASELHPILALPWVSQTLNEGVLAEFLAAEWYSRDETMWNGVMRLVAAHCMQVGNGGPGIERYWEPDLWAALPYRRDEEYFEHYRELFAESVRRLSRSHRAVACEVSGGLDSSAIFCMAEHLRQKGSLPAPGIDGYTLAFVGDSGANELVYARAVGDYLGVQIHEVPPSTLPLDWYVDRARVYQECPTFPNGSMLQALMQQASAQGSRVLLNGIGGDDWLVGSRMYYAEELSQANWSALFDNLRSDIAAFGSWRALRWFARYGAFPQLPTRFQEALLRLNRRMRGIEFRDVSWLSPGMRERIDQRRRRNGGRGVQQVRCEGQRELISTLFDNAVMDWGREDDERLGAGLGLEKRRPLDTAAFVQFAFSTPERLRLRSDRTKFIHVRALAGLMPQAILERKSKAEFSIVFDVHLDQMQELFTESLPQRRADWVTRGGMARLYASYLQNQKLGWPLWILWAIYGCDKLLTGQ